jgi:hypothetical protein
MNNAAREPHTDRPLKFKAVLTQERGHHISLKETSCTAHSPAKHRSALSDKTHVQVTRKACKRSTAFEADLNLHLRMHSLQRAAEPAGAPASGWSATQQINAATNAHCVKASPGGRRLGRSSHDHNKFIIDALLALTALGYHVEHSCQQH